MSYFQQYLNILEVSLIGGRNQPRVPREDLLQVTDKTFITKSCIDRTI